MSGGRSHRWDWNVAVFCRNEQFYIADCLQRIAAASRGHSATVTVIINGSSDDSARVAYDTTRRLGLTADFHGIAHGDKANAINRFFYDLRDDARLYFFVDGYTRIAPTAFQAMDASLSSRPEIVAATGVATNGRTMRLATPAALARGGQLHGQLHALRHDFIDRLVGQRLRLPIGLYYGDGLIGSMAMHDLDAINTPWDTRRIAARPDASYEIPSLSLFRLRDLRRQFFRKVRQMRGRLENLAITSIIYRHGYQGLPEYSHDMVRAYLAEHGVPRVPLVDRPFMALALEQVRKSQRPQADRLIPSRLFA